MEEKIVWNKRQMFEEMRRGDYGNTMRTASTLDGLVKQGIGLFGVRSTKVGWPYFRTVMSFTQLMEYMHNVLYPNDEVGGHLIFCESHDHAWNVINGEFCRTGEDYLVMKYLEGPNINQREAMTCGKAKTITNAAANLVMRDYFSPASYNNAMRLLEEYECGSVIEFTVVDRFVGTEPHNNVIFWEVRSRY